jgi:two-component system response regulator WspF
VNIGIVNDMALAVEALRRAVTRDSEHRVIWVARDGVEAVELCARETPDLVLMDMLMPGMDGVEATRRIMAATPCAILIVTVSVGANARLVYEAMGYGALDAVDTPQLGTETVADAAPLLAKIDTIRRLIGDSGQAQVRPERAPDRLVRSPEKTLIAIGASAGGPSALATLLSGLPKSFGAAVVIIQHVDQQFALGMASYLNAQSAMPVRVANEGDRPAAGTVLLAATNDHLTFKTMERLGYTPEPTDYAYRPSVDVFFHSVSRFWPGTVIGVLLTGMGRDGAAGLKALRDKGCYTIAQDRASSAVYGMPKAARALDAAVETLSLSSIAPRLIRLLADARDGSSSVAARVR